MGLGDDNDVPRITLLECSLEHGLQSGEVQLRVGQICGGHSLMKCFFNHSDLPCYMTVEEMKSLIRLPDIIACAKQSITTAEISARDGTGLATVLLWLQEQHR